MELKGKNKKYKNVVGLILGYKNNFLYSADGLKYALVNEKSFIIIILAMVVTTILGLIFKIHTFEWLFIITAYGCVFGCEMLNSAIEAAVDLCTKEIHPLAKIAKDCGSAATLVFSIMAFIGALIIFIPKLF